MATRRKRLADIGGFAALADCLADDYQLGHRIARQALRIELCPIVVDCCSAPMGWGAVWKHQVRWARTIRVCQPLPYFFSILSNATLWPLLFLAITPSGTALALAAACGLARIGTALQLQRRIESDAKSGAPASNVANEDSRSAGLQRFVMPLLKDVLQAAIWLMAFAGNTIEWRGNRFRLRPDGTIVPVGRGAAS
jgi:ceramide glucosyltransferase